MRYILFILPILTFGQSIHLTPANPVAAEGSTITISADRPVHFTLTGAGSLSVQNAQTVTYSAPVSLSRSHVLNGCMVTPADSVFNTRIDQAPVHPNSTAWMQNLSAAGISITYQWGTNVVNNSATYIPQYFNYTTNLNGTPFPILSNSARRRETGSYTSDGYNDHHMLTVNHQSCTFYETYQDGVAVSGCPTCTAASGATYSSTNYSEFEASTDAAGLPLAPLTVHLDEIEAGAITHALRFTACAGCISQNVLWPAVSSTGWSSSGIPMGARVRLKNSFDISAYPQAAQVLLTALKQYGMFLADIGMEGQISFSSDVTRDTAITQQLASITGLSAENFEVADESSLMLNQQLTAVNPGNPYVKPNNSALLTVTDVSNPANVVQVPIALEAVTVGTPEPMLTVQAGTNPFQISAWVNGTANQGLKWSINPAVGAGSIDAQGHYTAPVMVSGITRATITITSNADPTAQANVALTIIPGGLLRIDTGSETATVDQNGNNWLPDLGFETGSYSDQNDWYPINAWSGIPNQTQYQTYKYTWGDDIVYRLHVPNGNYLVTLMLGMGGTNGTYNTSTFDNGLLIGPMSFEAQGQVTNTMWDLGIPTNYTGRTPASVGLPAQVTDTNLIVAVRASTTSIGHSAPFLNGITITPDSAAPSMTINSQHQIVLPGSTLQLHTTAWFTSTPNVQWSILSGPGRITTFGLYAAPSSVSSSQWVVVRAQDLTTGLSASINLFVPATGSAIPAGLH